METKEKRTKKSKWSKSKIRRYTFITMTCVFIVAAVLLFASNLEILGKWSDFMSQICIGAATGCFVVALQETVYDEEQIIDQKNSKNNKEE